MPWGLRRALFGAPVVVLGDRLTGLLEATVAMSALAHEPERWEAVLRSLVR